MTWEEERLKFWYETARTIVLATAGAIAAYLIIDPARQERAYEAFLAQQQVELRRKVVDDFLVSSYRYTSVAYDSLNDERLEPGESRDEIYDHYRADLSRMHLYFGAPLDSRIQLIELRLKSLWKEIKEKDKAEGDPIRRELKEDHVELAKAALLLLGLSRSDPENYSDEPPSSSSRGSE